VETEIMTTLKASKTRIPPDAFNRVAYQRDRIRIERRGGRPVYIVSEEDLELLEKLEDIYWAEEGRKAIAEFKRSGSKPVPWEKIRKRLGL
jgi:PHD/YefM family antitoxin component YafN of YafNO toxin-antitoxin module